jgi:hypothetical protein
VSVPSGPLGSNGLVDALETSLSFAQGTSRSLSGRIGTVDLSGSNVRTTGSVGATVIFVAPSEGVWLGCGTGSVPPDFLMDASVCGSRDSSRRSRADGVLSSTPSSVSVDSGLAGG